MRGYGLSGWLSLMPAAPYLYPEPLYGHSSFIWAVEASKKLKKWGSNEYFR